MQRNNLVSLVAVMFALVVLAFLYALVSGLSVPDRDSRQLSAQQFADLEAGQTVMRRISGRRVWLSRLSERQFKQITLTESQLVDPGSGCEKRSPFCALAAATAQDGIELSYTKAAPPQLPGHAIWIGGFVDPTTGAVFDLLGRAYRLNKESDRQRLEVVSVVD